MREYHKIETVFNRSTDGDKRLIWGDYRNETVEYLDEDAKTDEYAQEVIKEMLEEGYILTE